MQKINTKHIALAIYESAKDKRGKGLGQALGNAVDFLAKKNLLSKAPEILKHLQNISNDTEKIVEAKIRAPRPLTTNTKDAVRRALKKRYGAKEIIFDFAEDKSLIGGIRIEARNEVIDLSLKHKVAQLQNHLLNT